MVRLKNPLDGVVAFNDLVKGQITVANSELDDLVLLRADGVPTYNFGVVVDDLDMNITHVIRGDDHVNNTPRQINILRALGRAIAAVCACADDPGRGRRAAFEAPRRGFRDAVSRRWLSARGAGQLSRAAGLVAWRRGNFQPRAAGGVVRPCSHQPFAGEIRSGKAAMAQPAVSQELPTMNGWQSWLSLFLKQMAAIPGRRQGCRICASVANLLKERVNTVAELADAAVYFYRSLEPSEELKAQHFTAEAKPAILDLRQRLAEVEWESHAIHEAIKACRHGTWHQAAQGGHAAARDGDGRDPDAFDQRGAGIARPGGNPQARWMSSWKTSQTDPSRALMPSCCFTLTGQDGSV